MRIMSWPAAGRSLALVATLLAAPIAQAALPVGGKAPDFTLDAAMAGKTFRFALADALAKGPVVVYFYPAAFTPGCTVEAHLFAEATDEFRTLGARVIGVSKDDIETLKRFSVSECRSQFAVAADPGLGVAGQYDARMSESSPYASRTSYVIAPDGSILSALTDPKPGPHVQRAREVLQQWHAAHTGH